MYAVIACPRCRRSRVVAPDQRTAECGACGRALAVRDQRVWFSGPDLEEARHMVGMVNARLSGRSEEFARAHAPAPPRAPRGHDDAFMAAAAASRRRNGEAPQADAVARQLSSELGEFAEDDLARAFAVAGLPKVEAHLARMLRTHVVFEPRAGRYRAA